MTESFTNLSLAQLLQEEAEQIFSSYRRAKQLHNARNIRASGNEVEKTVREVIQKKVPNKYYCSQGHLLDFSGRVSPQLDFIIADTASSPILFKAEDQTEYFPYESVYAIGEIKSTYSKNKREIEKFIDTITNIKSNFRRAETKTGFEELPNLVAAAKAYGNAGPEFDLPHLSPLFTFMFFVNSNGFQLEDIEELYLSQEISNLPNILCFLDLGVVYYAALHNGNAPNVIPEFAHILSKFNRQGNKITDNPDDHWVFDPLSEEGHSQGARLAFLYYMLNTHLKNCHLTPPNLILYFSKMFKLNPEKIRVIHKEPNPS